MRRWLKLFGFAMASACARETPPAVPTTPVVTALTVAEAPPRPSQYLLADGPAFVRVEGTDSFGAIVNGLRVVQNGPIARIAAEETAPPLLKATKLPNPLGGGFLFRSKNALFSSPTFDGPLKPVCGFMADIDDVSMGPSYVLVHLSDGDRVAIDPRTGARAAISPPGLVAVGALDDGRVAVLTTFGAALVSADGKQWTDVTAQLNGHPDSIDEVDGELWIHATPVSARVEQGGKISLFDEEKTPQATAMRPLDARWHDALTPLRKAYRSGVLLDDGTALVVMQGALARVDVQTGALLSLSAMKLPTDADCDGVRTPDDVVFVCRRSSETFVASHGLSEAGFAMEKTFSAGQGAIFVGDDGAMAIAGSCSGVTADMTVCVRGVSGTWQEHVVLATSDGGAAMAPLSIERWVPKSDGNAIGLSFGASPAMVDTSTNDVTLLAPDALTNVDPGATTRGRYGAKRGYRASQIDRAWTATATGVRGWITKGTSVEIGFEGNVARAPYAFDRAVTSGVYGFAITGDAAFQSTDRGQHWTDVAPPPQSHGVAAIAIDDCGPLGCEIGGWVRAGWEIVAPPPPAAAQDRATAAKLPITTLPAISCAPAGPQRQKTVNKSGSSPNDLGFGAQKLAIKEDDEQLREAASYWLTLPQHPLTGTEDGETEPAMRMLATGYTVTTDDNGVLKASGPVPAIPLLRRQLGFLQAFDPTMQVRRTSVGMADYFAAARAIGLGGGVSTVDNDPLNTQTVVPLLGPDPAAGNDLVASYNPIDQGGAFAVVRPSGTRVAIEKDRTPDTSVSFLSAAQLGDDIIVLQAGEDAAEQILRWTGPVLAPLFEVPPPPLASYYPTNPDAIAIGPHGEIGVLRTPSGGEPPTKDDAALLYLPGQAPAPLAAWSTLVLADDPACKADPGWRAIVTTTRPWLRAATADGELTPTQTIMRVKWSATRVCLEALEAHLLETSKARVLNVNSPNDRPTVEQVALSSWLVWKVLGNATSPAGASKGAVGPGVEISQPLKCSL